MKSLIEIFLDVYNFNTIPTLITQDIQVSKVITFLKYKLLFNVLRIYLVKLNKT